jgi:Uma2 family endonuclease
MDELLHALGDIPLNRVRLNPPPGTATEADVERFAEGNRMCELVDGTLVEKPMGFRESRLAAVLGHFVEDYLEANNIGMTAGEQGVLRLAPGQSRAPDLSFIAWDKLPNRECPTDAVPRVVPDLAVEVLSASNTREEMARKRAEYFAAGVKLVWEVDPDARTVAVYTDPTTFTTLDETQSVEGSSVLPGFTLSIRRWFDRADRGG